MYMTLSKLKPDKVSSCSNWYDSTVF